MTDRSSLTQLVRQANPVDNPHDVADSLDLHLLLLAAIDERSEDMTSTKSTTELDRRQLDARPAIAFVAAVVILLVIVAGSTMLLRGSGTPIDEPADSVPTTAVPEPTTATDVDATPEAESADESASALTWVSANVSFSENSHPGRIAHANGRFVAAGVGIWHSEDLVKWTRVTDADVTVEGSVEIAVGLLDVNHLAAGPLGFVATTSGGSYVWDQGARGLAAVYVSEDGLTWTQSEIREPDAWDTLNIDDITPGGPGWVAVGHIGIGDGRIWVSEDGLSWETIVLPGFDGVTFTEVSEHDDQLTAYGTRGDPLDDDSTPLSWVSEDGLIWEAQFLQNQEINPATHSIAINPETGQRIALNPQGVWASDDGISWRQVASDNGTPPYTHPTHGAVWLGDTLLGVHRYIDWIFESTDGGTTWVRSHPFTHPDVQQYPHRLYVHDDKVIATLGGIWIGTAD